MILGVKLPPALLQLRIIDVTPNFSTEPFGSLLPHVFLSFSRTTQNLFFLSVFIRSCCQNITCETAVSKAQNWPKAGSGVPPCHRWGGGPLEDEPLAGLVSRRDDGPDTAARTSSQR